MIRAKGWTLAEDPTEDLGRSAWSGNHLQKGKLGKFAQRVFDGEIPHGSVLVVEKLDRLSRQGPDECRDWMRSMFRHGVKVASADGHKVYDENSDLMSTFEIFMKAALAQEESDKKSARVADAWDRRRDEAANGGRKITGRLPGWIVKGVDEHGRERPELHPQRHATVRLIYELAAEGLGHRQIARRLNADIANHPSWGHYFTDENNTGWEPTTIGQILKAPAVEGIYLPGKIDKETKRSVKTGQALYDHYPIAVDPDLVARARSAVAKRASTGGRYREQVNNLFTGLVRCGACGSKMQIRVTKRANGKSDRNFHCGNAHRGRGCDRREFFKYDPFEKAALNQILHLALDDRYFQQAPDLTYKLANTVAELRRRIDLKKIEETNTARNMGLVKNPAPFIAVMDAITVELEELAKVLSKAENDLSAARGAVEPTEHLRRVREVRGSLEDEDDEVRIAARRKVSEAIAGMDVQVRCGIENDGERFFFLLMAGGLFNARFDNHGKTTYVNGIGVTYEATDAAVADMKRLNPLWSPSSEAYVNRLKTPNDMEKPAPHPWTGAKWVADVPPVEGWDEEKMLEWAALSLDDETKPGGTS